MSSSFIGPPPVSAPSLMYPEAIGPAPAAAAGGGFGGTGLVALTGALLGAVGGFYAAKGRQYELRSQALSAEFEQFTSNLNARAAERDAQAMLLAGQHEVGLRGLQRAQQKGAERASAAARGVQGGVGSAAEVQASIEYAGQADAIVINSNAVRSAEAARTRGQDSRNRGLLAGTSAANLRGSSRSINPWLSAGTNLLGGASSYARQSSAYPR